jgi:hypothetical protein
MTIKTTKKDFKPKRRASSVFSNPDNTKKTRGRKRKDPLEEDPTSSTDLPDELSLPDVLSVKAPRKRASTTARAKRPPKTSEDKQQSPALTTPLQETYGDIYAALDAAAELGEQEQDGEIPSPVDLMKLAISADLDPSIFTEQSFPVAENVIDWCRNSRFLGFTGELRPKQYEVLTRFFSDVCYLCSDADYVHNVPVDDDIGNVIDRFVLLRHGICPKCRRNRTEMLSDWLLDSRFRKYNDHFEDGVQLRPVPPNEFCGVWGQRSGKSYTVATFATPYILHRYLALPNPPRYFNRPANVLFQATFVAPTLYQVEDNLWNPFREVYENSPWFKEVRKYLQDEGKRLGVELYHAPKRFILFPSKRIIVHIQAASIITLRGATRIFFALDELGHFNVTEDGKRRVGVKDGTEVFNALENSLVTVRSQANRRRREMNDYNALDAYAFNISSPSSVSDPIMLRAAAASTSPRMLYTHFATWEVNPDEDEETIKEQKASDKESLMRDFYAIPPRALSPFFPNHTLVKELVLEDAAKEYLFTYKTEKEERSDGVSVLRPVLQDVHPDPFQARILGVDNGERRDSFALCVARYDPDNDSIIYEEFLEVAPYKGYYVDLGWCYTSLIIPLLQAFNPVQVVFDQWQSAVQIHDLRNNYGVEADQYTLKWKDFEDFGHSLNDVKVRLPVPETDPDDLMKIRTVALRADYPRAHFQLQLTTVEQFGRRIMKPNNGTDDLFKTAVLCHAQILKNKDKYTKRALGRGRHSGRGGSVGSFRGASERGGARGSSSSNVFRPRRNTQRGNNTKLIQRLGARPRK